MSKNIAAWDGGFKQGRGDESLGNILCLALQSGKEQLHICDIDDVTTDWSLSADTNPALYIHGATTPATEYIKMYTDETDAHLNVAGANLDIDVPTGAQIALQVNNTDYFTINATDIAINKAIMVQLGTFSGSTQGSGFVVSASDTAAMKIYADDGGAAIGSGYLVRAGWFRNLQTYTGGNREQESTGVQGSIVSVAGTNRHNMSGVLGSYEARTSLTVDGQDPATDPWVQAGVIGRVGSAASIVTINSYGRLAALAAVSNVTTGFAANNGVYAGLLVTKWTGTVDFGYGIYIDDACSTACIAGSGVDHLSIQCLGDNKNIRMNSRNLTATSGSHTAVQIKPQHNATGTTSCTGLECSPRFAAGVAGTDLRAVLADPVLKAGSGNVAGQVVGVEVNLDFGTSGTRTITGDVSAFSTFLAVPSTYTYSGDVAVLRVRTVNIRSWSHFINFDDASTGCTTSGDKTGGSKDYYLPVLVGSSEYAVQLYAV